jgi:dTDP-4-amino-4,6-dideoxygalactose transaminase
VILLPEKDVPSRADLISDLKKNGVETNIGTWHIPLTAYFRARYGHEPGYFPVADQIFTRTLTLPIYEGLTQAEQAQVVCTLLDCLNV